MAVLALLSPASELASAQAKVSQTTSPPNLPPVAVSPPDQLLRQILSPDSQVRVRALKVMGVSQLFFTPKTETGEDYTITTGARLLYGHYSKDQDLAVIALQMHDSTWAAVLIRRSSAWERIGIFGCCCKYEANPLEGFVELRPVLSYPQTDILVHDTGGGTGLYDRRFSVFHLQRGHLEKIYDTTDKRRDCYPTDDYCTLTEVKLEFSRLSETPAIIKIELQSIEPVPSTASLPLEVYKNVKRLSCQGLLWDTARERFNQSRQWSQSYFGGVIADNLKNSNREH